MRAKATKAENERHRELRRFLRDRRSRISPAEAGLPAGPDRRASGLRREDVAELAEISVAWYGQFELGRAQNASAKTVHEIARALQLDTFEESYLFGLAGLPDPYPFSKRPADPQLVDAARLVVNSFTGPAFVSDEYFQALASNAQAVRLLGVVEGTNNLYAIFTDHSRRGAFVDWDHFASLVVSSIRLHVTRMMGDERFDALLQKLLNESTDFRRHWELARRLSPLFGERVQIRMPNRRVATFMWAALPLPIAPNATLVIATPTDERGTEAVRRWPLVTKEPSQLEKERDGSRQDVMRQKNLTPE